MVGINWPIFFIRDAIKFPDFVHATKPSAVTGVQDANLAFDFFAHTPEATNMLTTSTRTRACRIRTGKWTASQCMHSSSSMRKAKFTT